MVSRRIVRELLEQINDLETEIEYVTADRDRLIAYTFAEGVPWISTQPTGS